MGTGEVRIDVKVIGGVPNFTETFNNTNGAVTFQQGDGQLTLTAKPGSYTFFYTSVEFTWAIDAVTWLSDFHKNLAWILTDDRTQVVMSNLNFVPVKQTVEFNLNPAPELAEVLLLLRPIDPTIINDPQPAFQEIAAEELAAVAMPA